MASKLVCYENFKSIMNIASMDSNKYENINLVAEQGTDVTTGSRLFT